MTKLQDKYSERYSPPVSKLLTYGVIKNWNEWPDYLRLGLTAEHIPDLIRLALDKELNWLDSDAVEIWGPIHALRALGQLRAEAAVEPLIPLLHEFENDNSGDWISSELPRAFAMIGTVAFQPLLDYFQDETHTMYPRLDALDGLKQIAANHSEYRDQLVGAAMQQLEHSAANDPGFNGFLIGTLVDMKVTEALPLIEKAYADDDVDWSITGDWDDVQVEFGLKAPDPNKKRHPLFPFPNPLFADTSPSSSLAYSTYRIGDKKKKAKRKQADKTRKMNRKRKKR